MLCNVKDVIVTANDGASQAEKYDLKYLKYFFTTVTEKGIAIWERLTLWALHKPQSIRELNVNNRYLFGVTVESIVRASDCNIPTESMTRRMLKSMLRMAVNVAW